MFYWDDIFDQDGIYNTHTILQETQWSLCLLVGLFVHRCISGWVGCLLSDSANLAICISTTTASPYWKFEWSHNAMLEDLRNTCLSIRTWPWGKSQKRPLLSLNLFIFFFSQVSIFCYLNFTLKNLRLEKNDNKAWCQMKEKY